MIRVACQRVAVFSVIVLFAGSETLYAQYTLEGEWDGCAAEMWGLSPIRSVPERHPLERLWEEEAWSRQMEMAIWQADVQQQAARERRRAQKNARIAKNKARSKARASAASNSK